MKIKKILAILTLCMMGCSDKEILRCNLETLNGKTYSDSKLYNGTCHFFTGDNEILWKTLTYKRGKLYKEIAYYLDTGQIEYIGFRDNDGNIDGLFERYFKNGQLELKGKLNKGYRSGNWEVYNENGELKEEILYDSKGNVAK